MLGIGGDSPPESEHRDYVQYDAVEFQEDVVSQKDIIAVIAMVRQPDTGVFSCCSKPFGQGGLSAAMQEELPAMAHKKVCRDVLAVRCCGTHVVNRRDFKHRQFNCGSEVVFIPYS